MGFATDYKKYWDAGPIVFLKMCKCASTSVRGAIDPTYTRYAPEGKPMFTVVRNPYTRLVSAWTHRVNGGELPFHNSFMSEWGYWKDRIYRGMPFDDFVDLVTEIPDEKCECHFCPTSYVANQCLKDGSVWFKVEELPTKWPPFAAKYGFDSPLSQKMKTDHSSCREIYTDALHEKVYERYKADFEMWGYGKELPQ